MTQTLTKLQQTRQLLISLLDDANGISSNAYDNLRELVNETIGHDADDIFDSVDACEGRYFLNEDHNLQP